MRALRRRQSQDHLETVKATLETARQDVEDETDRMKVIDTKLTNLAAFSGVSISISSSVGASVIAADRVPFGFQIALGGVLIVSAALLLLGVRKCFGGLAPKLYLGVDEEAATARLTPRQLKRSPEFALATMASTQVNTLKRARTVNEEKADAATRAFALIELGFVGLIIAIPVTVVGTVL